MRQRGRVRAVFAHGGVTGRWPIPIGRRLIARTWGGIGADGIPGLLAPMAGQAGQCVGSGQLVQLAPVQRGAAGQVVHINEGMCHTRLGDALGGRLAQTLNQAQAQAIQIDHVVSLSDAWASGAWEWTPQERIAFANDLGNLLAVDGPTNQAKSDQGPPHWLPEVNRCRYVEQYVQVKDTYGLGVSDDAIAGLRNLLQQCP